MYTQANLSKSRYTAGLQCHRLLWWQVHEPDALELVRDLGTQARMDTGVRVGELARTYVPGGTSVGFTYQQVAEKLALTQQLLAAGNGVIYGASFEADHVFVEVDILERDGDGWRVIEVKSTTSVKGEHLPDAAVQTWVVERAGLRVNRVELMHLNGACRYPRLDDLFVRENITSRVRELLPGVPARVRELLDVLEGELPDAAIGQHCREPYECPFKERCWAALPEHHVTTLYYAGRKAWDLVRMGYDTVDQLPTALCPRPTSLRQRQALAEGRRIVEPSLGAALEVLRGPLAYLDFETVGAAIPMWDGCWPYQQVPAQFSCHREDGRGGHEHREWVADRPGDPREPLARALVDACAGAASIVTWNVSFERGRIRELAGRLGGGLARELMDVERRLVDLLPVVREHVYDPEFHGSFSLKAVLPVLVPGATYDGLDVQEGGAASVLLERLVSPDVAMAPDERQRMAQSLRDYCRQDTWATVVLVGRLREMAGDR